MPQISVLIPCHNSAPWLRIAIDSVLRQSIQDIEVLVYDDGSTDSTSDILREIAQGDARVLPMGSGENRGVAHALNTMFGVAQGAYIARMDSDDISLPNRFYEQLIFMKDRNIDLCGSWFQEFGLNIPKAVRWASSSESVHSSLLFQNSICHPTVMGHREVFESFSYRQEFELAEDYDLFSRAMIRYRLANVPKVLLRYRRHAQQATRARRLEMESITCKVRIEALRAQGIFPNLHEQRIHNLIRAPRSIRSIEDLDSIESWLIKLLDRTENKSARLIIASQWTRAAVRAAPMGRIMWKKYRESPLYDLLDGGQIDAINLALLSVSRLDYNSRTFEFMRRFGIGV